MPIQNEYWSDIATLNADGSISMSYVYYQWDGSVFRKQTDPGSVMPALNADQQAQRIGGHANTGNTGPYADYDDRSKIWISPIEVVLLRSAIDKGYTTQEQALATFGSAFLSSGARWWAFSDNLPSTVTADKEESFFRVNMSNKIIMIADVLTKPNAWANTDLIDAGHSWAVPVGTSEDAAIGAAWSNSSLVQLATAAETVKTGGDVFNAPVPSGGGGTGAAGTSAVPFALSPTPYADHIAKAYVAFFNRPADAVGYNYYAEVMARNGGDWSGMTAGFGHSPEYLQTYAGLNTQQRIDAIYQNLFNRSAEADGLRYWGSRLDNGTFTINDIAISILVGAQNADLATVNNRVAVAKAFTNTFDTWGEVNAYSGLGAAARARDLLKTVTDNPATVTAATASLSATFKTLGASGTVQRGATGDTFNLGSSIDVLIYGTLDAGHRDVVNGFSGDDMLDLSALRLTNQVASRSMSSAQTTDSAGFFGTSSVVISPTGSDTYVYVDANKDGNFTAAADLVIRVVGAAVVAADITI